MTSETNMAERGTPQITELDDGVTIEVERSGQVPELLVVRMKGQVDFFNSRYFGRQLRSMIESGETQIVLDMRGLSYMSSTGVGELVGIDKAMRMASGSMGLFGIADSIMNVLSLLGFAGFLTISDTEREAVARMTSPDNPSPFPKVRNCPACRRGLRLAREGRFRCPVCHAVLRVSSVAEILLA